MLRVNFEKKSNVIQLLDVERKRNPRVVFYLLVGLYQLPCKAKTQQVPNLIKKTKPKRNTQLWRSYCVGIERQHGCHDDDEILGY